MMRKQRLAKPGAKSGYKSGNAGPSDYEKSLKRSEMLLGISRKLAAIESIEEILETLVGITTSELGAERSSLFLCDCQTAELYSVIAQGNFKRRIHIPVSTGIAGHVFRT